MAVGWAPTLEASVRGTRGSAAPDASAALGERLHEYVSGFAEQGDFSGVVLVTLDGRTVLHRAYGPADRELGVANALDTRFRLASVSKTFTAAAILALRDRGELRLEDPLARWVDGWPEASRITLRHLLSHSSGIVDFHQRDDYESIRRQHHSLADLVGLLAQTRLEFEPGSKSAYNNAGYVVLAYVIERVAGEPYGEFLRRQFFEPLSMSSTVHPRGRQLVPRRATGYEFGPRGTWLHAEWYDPSHLTGSGSLVSTASDLERWAEAVRERRPVDVYAESWPWGWGRRRDDDTGLEWIEQTGLLPGFQSCLKVYSNRRATIIYLGNIQSVAFSQFRQDLETLLFSIDRPLFSPPQLRSDLPASTFSGMLGTYRHPQAGDFTLGEVAGSPVLVWTEWGVTRHLHPISPRELYERSEGVTLRWPAEGQDPPTEVLYESSWGTDRCPRLDAPPTPRGSALDGR